MKISWANSCYFFISTCISFQKPTQEQSRFDGLNLKCQPNNCFTKHSNFPSSIYIRLWISSSSFAIVIVANQLSLPCSFVCNMESLISTIFALFFLLGASDALSRTIIVDKNGQGKFTTVQQAIDSIPENNSLWTQILVKHGVYT